MENGTGGATATLVHKAPDNNAMNAKPLGTGPMRSPRIASLFYPLRQFQNHPRLGYRGRYQGFSN